MSKLSKANYILGTLFLLSLVASIGNDIKVVERYGWIYDKTTIIGGDISTETINMKIVYFNYVFMGTLIVVLFKNGRIVNNSFTFSTEAIEESGITFPKGKPEYWFVEAGLRERSITVGIDEFEVAVPLPLILSWFEKVKDEHLDNR